MLYFLPMLQYFHSFFVVLRVAVRMEKTVRTIPWVCRTRSGASSASVSSSNIDRLGCGPFHLVLLFAKPVGVVAVALEALFKAGFAEELAFECSVRAYAQHLVALVTAEALFVEKLAVGRHFFGIVHLDVNIRKQPGGSQYTQSSCQLACVCACVWVCTRVLCANSLRQIFSVTEEVITQPGPTHSMSSIAAWCRSSRGGTGTTHCVTADTARF
jgi:hypothetical protein